MAITHPPSWCRTGTAVAPASTRIGAGAMALVRDVGRVHALTGCAWSPAHELDGSSRISDNVPYISPHRRWALLQDPASVIEIESQGDNRWRVGTVDGQAVVMTVLTFARGTSSPSAPAESV